MDLNSLKYALLAIVAAVASFLGFKAGRRGADKRVSDVASGAADRMQEGLRDRLEEDLAEIDDRDYGGNAEWVRDELRRRAGLVQSSEEKPEG